MIKTHIYANNHSYTVKGQTLDITILRSHSVKDGDYARPKGRQTVMIEVSEKDGRLIITNKQTGQSVLF